MRHDLLQAGREQGVLVGTCTCGEQIRATDLHELAQLMTAHAAAAEAADVPDTG